MGQKFALIIATSEYQDAGLARLAAPGLDAHDFAGALQAPHIGAFDSVQMLLNESEPASRRGIARFFAGRKPDDLLLLYFSGHGVRDDHGQLYLAVSDTDRSLLSATAIPANFINEQMNASRSRRQVLILDCCNSGAFAHGSKGAAGASMGIATAFEGTGYGRVVLTATDATQYAWEGDEARGEAANSVFTHFLVRGLETGEADANGDGHITLDELYDYVYERVVMQTPRQTPRKFAYNQQGELVIANNPRPAARPAELPAELRQALESPLVGVREAAVRELDNLLRGSHRGLALAAVEALERLADDDSRRVSAAAAAVLAANAEAQQRAHAEAALRELEQARQVLAAREAVEAAQRAGQAAAEKAEADKAEAARAEARRQVEAEVNRRVEAQKAAEDEARRQRAAQLERDRLAAEQAAAEKAAAEKAEVERQARAEAERLAAARQAAPPPGTYRPASRAEAEGLAAAMKTAEEEEARQRAARLERERLAAEQAVAEKAAAEKAEADRKAEEERLAREKLAAEQRAALDAALRRQAERERLAREKAEAEQRAAAPAQPPPDQILGVERRKLEARLHPAMPEAKPATGPLAAQPPAAPPQDRTEPGTHSSVAAAAVPAAPAAPLLRAGLRLPSRNTLILAGYTLLLALGGVWSIKAGDWARNSLDWLLHDVVSEAADIIRLAASFVGFYVAAALSLGVVLALAHRSFRRARLIVIAAGWGLLALLWLTAVALNDALSLGINGLIALVALGLAVLGLVLTWLAVGRPGLPVLGRALIVAAGWLVAYWLTDRLYNLSGGKMSATLAFFIVSAIGGAIMLWQVRSVPEKPGGSRR